MQALLVSICIKHSHTYKLKALKIVSRENFYEVISEQ